MTYREALSQHIVAISVSDSPDMPALGLSDQHLSDAMTEIARHLLALGSRVAYGGDLRTGGFTQLLFELVSRHKRDADEGDDRASALSYLAWPVHILKTVADLEQMRDDLIGAATLVLLDRQGQRLSIEERSALQQHQPNDKEWRDGLTSMREVMRRSTHARVVLGGRVDHYKGSMPGIAEEALLSLEAKQPLFLMGGFGGCARDLAEDLGIVPKLVDQRRNWSGRDAFDAFSGNDLNNGLSEVENKILAQTPHVDQAVAMMLRGLLRLGIAASQNN